MNEKVTKVKRFVKKHKAEFITAGVAVASCIALGAIDIKTKFKFPKSRSSVKNLDIPTEFNVGSITDLWKEGEWLNAIVADVKVKDIGRLGEEFVKQGLVAAETDVQAVIGFAIE